MNEDREAWSRAEAALTGWLPALGLLVLALLGAAFAALSLLLGRPLATALIGAGALATAAGAVVWLLAPGRLLAGSLPAIAGILAMMAGCALGGA